MSLYRSLAAVAAIVASGYLVKRLLPAGWFSTLGLLAYIGFFVLVWWTRRGSDDRHLRTQEWEPPRARLESGS